MKIRTKFRIAIVLCVLAFFFGGKASLKALGFTQSHEQSDYLFMAVIAVLSVFLILLERHPAVKRGSATASEWTMLLLISAGIGILFAVAGLY